MQKFLDDINVQGDIKANNLNNISHVGMIIFSNTLSTSDQVAAIYGGTKWELITDRFLIGAGNNYAVNSTGGTTSVTLTANNMPTHNHGYPSTSSSLAAVTDNHTHTNVHTHAAGSATSGAASSSHYHQLYSEKGTRPKGTDYGRNVSVTSSDYESLGYNTTTTGAHTHTLSGTFANVSVPANPAGAHTHSVTFNAVTSGSAGASSPTAVSVLNPYKAVYIWERTE